MDLQLTLWSTKTGIKNFFFLSPGSWNVKEMAEPQLQTITKHFQWSWEMPWIQSITSEAWITPLWRALPSDEPIFSASSAKFKDLRIRPLLRLGLLTPKIKNLSLFFFLTFLSLPGFRSVFQNIFRMIPSVFAHHRKCKSLLAGREPPLHSAHSGGSFPSVPSNKWANREMLPVWTFLLFFALGIPEF